MGKKHGLRGCAPRKGEGLEKVQQQKQDAQEKHPAAIVRPSLPGRLFEVRCSGLAFCTDGNGANSGRRCECLSAAMV